MTLTPSTALLRKLMGVVKRPRRLSALEIALLRRSKREIHERLKK